MIITRRRLFWFGLFYIVIVFPAIAQQSLLGRLERLRSEYPTPMSSAQVGELLTRTAASAPNWRLLRKDTGNRCPTPMGVDVSCDILVYAPIGIGYDVLRDSEGLGVPVWNPSNSFPSDRLVIPVWSPTGPVVPPTDLGPLYVRIEELHNELQSVKQTLEHLIASQQPPPIIPTSCRASILGIPIRCTIK